MDWIPVRREANFRRRLVAKRDNGRCQICGICPMQWEVHHIVSQYLCRKAGLSPAQTHCLQNLATLCPDCHKIADRGNFPNVQLPRRRRVEQYLEWWWRVVPPTLDHLGLVPGAGELEKKVVVNECEKSP